MSEVAKLREKMELECKAMKLGLSGLAMTARHEIIFNRYTNLGTHERILAEHVGAEAAHEIMVDTYTKIIG